VIGVGAPLGPILGYARILILLPKAFDEFPDIGRCADLFESEFSVVLHRMRLAKGHGDAVVFCTETDFAVFAVMLYAALEKVVVFFLFVAEPLDGHSFVFGGCGVVGWIGVVGEPGIICGDCFALNGKRNIYSVFDWVVFGCCRQSTDGDTYGCRGYCESIVELGYPHGKRLRLRG